MTVAPSPEMIRRVAAAQSTKDQWVGRVFRWGRSDCARLAASHLRAAGFERAAAALFATAGSYSTALGARRALRKAGFASLTDALDALGLERIAPASARVGDLVQGAAGDDLPALGVALGNGALVGFHELLAEASTLRAIDLTAAWRVPF